MGDHPAAQTAHNSNPSNDADKFADPSGEMMKVRESFRTAQFSAERTDASRSGTNSSVLTPGSPGS